MLYSRRILDTELDELLAGVSAVAIEGPKAVGKTATAIQRANTVYRLDDPSQAAIALADPSILICGPPPVLIDEWQRVPESWDVIRRAVDADSSPSRFLLTGSANPANPSTHSGAGRIVRVRMRPMSLAERGVDVPSVSLRALLQGEALNIGGETGVSVRRYAEEILASGFPALRHLSGRPLRAQLESYVSRIVDRDFIELGHRVRNPGTVHRWLRAYAAATSTTTTFEKIREAATGGDGDKPARDTVMSYRSLLEQLWILDQAPAWLPTRNQLSRLSNPAKHHLADPALAGILLGQSVETLLEGDDAGVDIPRDGTLLGHLFESLVVQSVRVYAQSSEGRVRHLRTMNGRHEIDIIVERPDGRVVAIEVKLARTIKDEDVKHLHWLRQEIEEDLIDAVVINTGPRAYRRKDGIAVVPAALLGA